MRTDDRLVNARRETLVSDFENLAHVLEHAPRALSHRLEARFVPLSRVRNGKHGGRRAPLLNLLVREVEEALDLVPVTEPAHRLAPPHHGRTSTETSTGRVEIR